MTKDVLLSIKGLQIGENEQNDTIEVISPGDYYFRNGRHFFMYEEVMEGQKESTRKVYLLYLLITSSFIVIL